MSSLFFVISTFVFSLLIGWVGVPSIVIIAKVKRLFDSTSQRKVHSGAIPRLGGVSFFPAMMIAFCFSLGLIYYLGGSLPNLSEGEFFSEFMFFFAGLFLLYMVGLADDLVGVNYQSKFMVQLLSASMITMTGLYIHSYEGLLGLYTIGAIASSAITILLIVFVVNAFNLIDGVDGLCSGIGLLVILILGGWFYSVGEVVYTMLALSMAGVLVVFFYFNVMGNKLKIFMGDTGSLTVGFIVSLLSLKFLDTADNLSKLSIDTLNSPLSFILGLLFIPLFDTARLFFVRILSGRSPFSPDRSHIHHKLLDLGFNHLECTVTILSSTLGIFLLNLLMSELWHYNINVVVVVDIIVGITINLLLRAWRNDCKIQKKELQDDYSDRVG